MKWRLLRGNTFKYEKIPPQEPPLLARSSSIPRIRIGPISTSGYDHITPRLLKESASVIRLPLCLLTYLYFNPRSLTTIQDAKRMSIKKYILQDVIQHTYKFTISSETLKLMYTHYNAKKNTRNTKLNIM